MRNRAALLCAIALALVASWPTTSTNDGLQEHAAPIVVDLAHDAGPGVIAGPEHEVDPETQRRMEEHAAELRARQEANDAFLADLPAAFASALGGMTVTYNASHPAPSSVRSVIDAAVAQWDSVIATNGSGPIVVEVYWSSLGNPSLLGYAGPDGMFTGGGLPEANTLYPAALTNTLLGLDANGPSRPEIQVVLNAELLAANRWYVGTTGTPPSGKIDLYSVVLHEVGHGLGFLGSATVPAGQSNPSLGSTPYIYDRLARAGATGLVATSNQSSALRSGDVHAEVSESVDYELYAPSTWITGSSFSHFDESIYPGGTAGALMTPMLGSSETARILDSPTLGLMARMGWPLTVAATTPTITSASPSLTAAVLSWNQNLWKTGTTPDHYVIEAWRNNSRAATITVPGSSTGAVIGSLSPGGTYTIKVIPWGPNGNGASASTSVQLPLSGGPADPADWPPFLDNTALEGQINRLYQAYFLRLPDEGGFDYWLDQRIGGASLNAISGAFAGSAEFRNRYGSLSDPTFVDLVYANVLNRVADPEGRAFWIGQLSQGVSRGEVMVGFAESNEYITRTRTVAATDAVDARIIRLYRAFFLRDPDASGLAYWGNQVRSGVPLEAVAQAFASSTEFRNRYGSLSNAQFVQLVYGNVLSRAADAGGAAYWTSLLDGGTNRGSVMLGFSESAEFIRRTGTIP